MGHRQHADVIGQLTRPGAQIGRYLVIHPLGRGGMGVVVAAYDPELDRRVAIKLLHRNRPKSRTRLQREAQAMARVSHPNVVAIFDVGTVAEQVFIAMEHVEGQTLHEWSQKPHPWQEVLSVFIAAGRGLQAAHEVGLVHRDFKLENVLLSRDGLPKVTDFGLVRASLSLSDSRSRHERSQASHDEQDEDEDEQQDSANIYSSDVLSTPITRIGALVGTPAFMAPEQFIGRPADTRSDQFSFCVALHVALWGLPPFPGSTVEELRARVLAGRRAQRPRERHVPSWVTEIVDRGLRLEPEQRWPSMSELLDALARDPSQRRRRRLALGATIGLCASLAAGIGAKEYAGAARCVALAERVHTHWDATQREATHAAMLATGTSYAEDSWSRTDSGLERWIESWERERVASCEAERDAERDAPARSRCLDLQLDALTSLVEVLRQSQRGSLAHAVEGVVALPQPERCADQAWLARFAELDEEGEQGLQLRRELSRIRARARAGREREAAALARDLLERIRRDGGPEASAVEASLVLGQATRGAARDVSELDEALELLERSYYDAAGLGLDRLSFDVALSLVRVSVDRSRFELAERWSRHARALARRLGERPEDLAEVHLARGLLARSRGELEQAEAALREALAVREDLHEAGHPSIAAVRFELGHTLILRRHYDPAREVLERARSSWIASLGPEHPRVSELETRLAEADRSQGDYARVIRELERILAQQERTLGREHRAVASTLGTLSVTHAMSGDKQRALPLQREALDIYQRVLGPEHPILAGVYANLGIMLKGLGRVDEAISAFERSAALTFAIYGEDSPASGKAHARLGSAYYERQQYEAAFESTDRAVALMRTKSGELDAKSAFTLGLRGTIECRLGRHTQGIASLAHALELVEAQREADHPQLSEFLVEIGECQAAGGQGEQALASWERAGAILAKNFGSEDPRYLQLLVDMGELQLDRGHSAEALELATRAERGTGDPKRTSAALDSAIAWLCARALWERGLAEDRPRARLLAAEARLALAMPDPSGPVPESETLRSEREAKLEAIDSWLASR